MSSKRISEKDWTTTLILSILLGMVGAHRFYVGKIGTGILWLLTGGCFAIGWIVDIILVASSTFTDKDDALILSDDKKYKASTPNAAPTAPRTDYAEQIAALAKLRDSGAITEQEYNDKKAILLDKIK